MSPPKALIMPTLPNSNISENNSMSSVSYSTFGQSTTSSNTSVSKVVDERANKGNIKSLSRSGKEDPVVKKRKRTSEICQYGVEILAKEDNRYKTYKAFQCSYCSLIGKITSSGSTTIVRHHFFVCKPWLEQQKRA